MNRTNKMNKGMDIKNLNSVSGGGIVGRIRSFFGGKAKVQPNGSFTRSVDRSTDGIARHLENNARVFERSSRGSKGFFSNFLGKFK